MSKILLRKLQELYSIKRVEKLQELYHTEQVRYRFYGVGALCGGIFGAKLCLIRIDYGKPKPLTNPKNVGLMTAHVILGAIYGVINGGLLNLVAPIFVPVIVGLSPIIVTSATGFKIYDIYRNYKK